MEPKTCRRWCFTSFNVGSQPAVPESKCRCLVYQMELCSKTNRKHWQGYLELPREKTFDQVKKLFCDNTVHLEQAKYTREHCFKYCTKTGKGGRVEGTEAYIYPADLDINFKGQGNRSDLKEIQVKLDEGKSIKEISKDHFQSYLQYERGFTKYKLLNCQKRTKQTKLIILYGGPGTGKTETVIANTKSEDIFWLGQQHSKAKWWDEYENQKFVCIDNFRPDDWDYIDLLHLADKKPYKVRVLYGYTQFNADAVIITTTEDPNEWYKYEPENAKEIQRRITKVYKTEKNPMFDKDFPVYQVISELTPHEEDDEWLT